MNPNGKIPAIIDPDGPGGQPIGLFESGAILFYLAEKTGQLHADATHPPGMKHCTWLMFQMANIGPFFGQVGFFYKYAGSTYEDKRPLRALRHRVATPAGRSERAAARSAMDNG